MWHIFTQRTPVAAPLPIMLLLWLDIHIWALTNTEQLCLIGSIWFWTCRNTVAALSEWFGSKVKKNYENLLQFRLSSNNKKKPVHKHSVKSWSSERLNWILACIELCTIERHLLRIKHWCIWCLLIYIFHRIKNSVSCKWKIWFIKPFSHSTRERKREEEREKENSTTAKSQHIDIKWITVARWIESTALAYIVATK